MKTKIALIYSKYNQANQPYLTIWGNSLRNFPHYDIRIFTMQPSSYQMATSLSSPRKSLKLIRLLTYLVMQLKKERNIKRDFWQDPKIVSRYLPLIRWQPKILHFVNSHNYSNFIDWWEKLRTKTIVSFRGYDIVIRPLKDSNWCLTLQDIFNRASALHFVSHYLKNEAIRLGAPEDKCVVIHPSTDTSLFESDRNYETNGTVKLFSTGRLTWQKGFPQGLLAVQQLVKSGVDVKYLIAGEGSEREHLLYMIQALGLEKSVTLLGQLSQEKLREELHSSDIYFHPSETEAISVAVMEAALMGLPIVASSVGGLREAVVHQQTGLLVDPYEPATMAAALTQLIRSESLRRSLGQAAQRDAKIRFSIERETREWESLYRSLIDNN